MNEEEVKNRVVVPWLTAAGVPHGELHFERTFRVTLGRHTVQVGAGSSPSATARLDILVTRQRRNLLVVEVKAEGLALTDDDRDQGISYARLVNPVAPFVLLTNGRDYHLYDTLTKTLVDNSTRVSREYSVALPDEQRIEALQLFLASSPENVLRLSAAQIECETASLRGEPTDLGAVYIAAAHRTNASLVPALTRFLQSTSSLFVVVGEAGLGKTCAAIDIATSLLADGYPTFFYQGGMLESNVLDAIWAEIAWTFNEQSDRVRALRHLSNQSASKPFVIVVDALDEWTSQERAKHLRWLAQHIDPSRTRIVATCKDAAWAGFLAVRGQQTGIDRYTFDVDAEKRCSLSLNPLTHREFHQLLDRYRAAFGVFGGVDLPAQDAGRRSPFLLRLMFQVAAASGRRDITLYSPALFERYLELAVGRTQSADASRHVLRTVAGLMFDHDRDWLNEDEVRASLQLRPTEGLPGELFANRLLNVTGPLEARRVAFTFAQLRSYVIAFMSRKWDRMDDADFEKEIARIQGLVRSEAMALYYAVAPERHKRALEGPIRENATAYVQSYRRLIAQHFPALHEAFLPYTKGAIGIAATLQVRRRHVEMFGFRPRAEDEPEVLIVPVEASDDHTALFWLDIVLGHGGASARAFTTGDVERSVLTNEVARQVKEIVDEMMLVETPALAREAVSGALRQYAEKFSKLMQVGDRREPMYPVLISAIRDEYRRDALRAGFREDVVKEKRARGEIRETWNGPIVSYSANLTPQETAEIERRVERAMTSAETPNSGVTLVDSERMWRRLSRSLEELEARGFTSVDKPSTLDVSPGRGAYEAKPEEFLGHCRKLLEEALASYTVIVKTNFPTLARHFRLYSAMPCHLVLAVPETSDRWGVLYFCDGATRNEVEVFAAHEVVELHRGARDRDAEIETPVGRHASWGSQSASEAELIRGPSLPRSGKWIGEGVVRRWVYSWLRAEIDTALRALLSSAGISTQ